jgi:hypothetical protein
LVYFFFFLCFFFLHNIIGCRATEDNGQKQPQTQVFYVGGVANNAIQQIEIFVR